MWSHREKGLGHYSISKELLVVQKKLPSGASLKSEKGKRDSGENFLTYFKNKF